MMENKQKWLLVGLVLSVAVNIFAVGHMAGRGFAGGGLRGDGPSRVDFSLRELGKYLPEDKRTEVRMLLKDHRKTLVQHFGKVRESERTIRDLMSAETVDKTALVAALDQHEAVMQGLKMPMRDILLNVVATLDHETRVKLAENMFRHRFKGRHVRLKDGEHPEERGFRDPDGPPPGDEPEDGEDDMPPPSGDEGGFR